MNTLDNVPLVVFTLNDQRFAVPCEVVKRIVQVVEISCVPHKLKNTLGVVNVHGQIIPVLDIRHKLQLPENEINLHDLMLIIQNGNKLFSFVVNSTSFCLLPKKSFVEAREVVKEVDYVKNLAIDAKGIINILEVEDLV